MAMSKNLNRPEAEYSERELGFDYRSVSPDIARFLRGQADRIRRQSALSIIQIGKDLIAAKHYLAHGAFLTWVEREVCIPARTAQAYMQVAHWASGKGATVARLPPSLLYLLSAPSTPEEVIPVILKRVEAGEHMTAPAIRAELKALRERRAGVHNGPPAAQYSTRRNRKTEMMGASIEEGTVREAVGILLRGLSGSDFARVRDIMISSVVLSDPNLARNIAIAFQSVGAPPERTYHMGLQSPLAAE